MPVSAGLKDFKKNTEKEREKNREEKKKTEEESKNKPEEKKEECGVGCQIIGDILYAIFGALTKAWIDHNTSIYYADFPANGQKGIWASAKSANQVKRTITEKRSVAPEEEFEEEFYISGTKTTMQQNAQGNYEYKDVPVYSVRKVPKKNVAGPKETETRREIVEQVMPDGKRSFFNVELAGQSVDKETYALGGAFQTRFIGLAGLIGEYRQYRDRSDKLILSSLGLDVALVQGGYASWSFYGQISGFSGLLGLSGVGYGTRLQIFTAVGIAFDFRLGQLSMPDISFWDYDIRMGYFINRFQIFFGYRAIESDLATLAGWHGGVQAWF